MPLILPSNSISAGGYEVANSLRFNDDSSDYLNKTYGSAGNRKTWTFSAWLKLSSGAGNTIFSSYQDGNNWTDFYFSGSEKFEFVSYASGYLINFTSSQRFRDYSAWYHIVLAFDTTQATASNRIKFYVNGSQVTALDNNTYPTQNSDHKINSTDPHTLGLSQTNTAISYDGYMAEVCFIDGSQLDPTSFGEFDEDTGIWKPIDVSELTFGTNGFYLDFENSGSLGADVSGNGNNFTVNNLTSVDQSTDTPTNNYCTLNPLDPTADITLSEGNLKGVYGTSATRDVQGSTFGVSSGKWYWEIKIGGATDPNNAIVGITKVSSDTSIVLGNTDNNWGYRGYDGKVFHNGADEGGSLSTFTSGDIIGIAINLDNLQGSSHKLYFSKNGVWQNGADPEDFTSTSGVYGIDDNVDFFPAISDAGSSATPQFEMNFGSPSFSISSGNTDGNGYGNFEYAVPNGFYALNTKNLAEYG